MCYEVNVCYIRWESNNIPQQYVDDTFEAKERHNKFLLPSRDVPKAGTPAPKVVTPLPEASVKKMRFIDLNDDDPIGRQLNNSPQPIAQQPPNEVAMIQDYTVSQQMKNAVLPGYSSTSSKHNMSLLSHQQMILKKQIHQTILPSLKDVTCFVIVT